MNKNELIESMAEMSGLTKAEATRALDAFTGTISASLSEGKDVAILGHGTYSANLRNARTGRNPQTGKELLIPAAFVVKFRPGQKLKDAANKREKTEA